MVLVGGLVAFIADKMGRTLGKKRLTLFNMRPRHTAMLITVLAGMLIPFVTVLFVAAVSNEARQWLAEGHKAIQLRDDAFRQRDQILANNEGLRSDNSSLVAQRANLQKSVDRLNKQNEEARRLAIGFRRDISAYKLSLAEYQHKVREFVSKVATLTAQVTDTRGQLKTTSSNLLAVQTKRDAVQKQYEVTHGAFNELSKQYSELNFKNIKLTSDYDKMSADFTRLAKDNADLESKNFKVRQELADNKWQLDRVALDLDRANASLSIADQQLAVAQKLVAADFKVSRFKRIILGMGDELARIPVPANTSPQDATGLVNNLLKQARLVASQLGAKPRTQDPEIGSTQLLGEQEVAGLFPRPDANHKTVPPEEQETAIAKGIAGSKEDLVLVATSFANTFEGEWVPLDVQAYPNPVVYKRSEIVAEGRLKHLQTDDEIYQQISEFLRTTVRPKALKDRMIPSGQQLGEVPTTDIFDTMKKIKAADRPVRLVARATEETRAADPLHLRLEVR